MKQIDYIDELLVWDQRQAVLKPNIHKEFRLHLEHLSFLPISGTG